MDVLYSYRKTDLKLQRLCVALYYNTAPTDYTIISRGKSVGITVAVNTEFVYISDLER